MLEENNRLIAEVLELRALAAAATDAGERARHAAAADACQLRLAEALHVLDGHASGHFKTWGGERTLEQEAAREARLAKRRRDVVDLV